MGLYPVAGQPLYIIGSPIFPSATFHLTAGKSFTVVAVDTSEEAKYVQSAELNGKPLRRAWLWHKELIAGGTLTLHMGTHPQPWDIATPPSGSAVWP